MLKAIHTALQMFFKFPFAFVLFALLTACAVAQSPSRILRRCPPPNTLSTGIAAFSATGDLNITPCPTRSTIFTGSVDLSGATVTGAVTGSGTINFIPRFTAASVLGDTPFSWNGTLYNFNNTALNAEFTQELTPSVGAGRFRVGDFTTTPTLSFDINQSTNTITTRIDNNSFYTLGAGAYAVKANVGITIDSPVVQVGDVSNSTNNTLIDINDSAQTFELRNGNAEAVFNLTDVLNYQYLRTVTAAGTTGNQTINRPVGTVNFAAGASDIVVTNSIATATSLIFCTVQTLDATATSCRVTDRAGGSFHIRVPAATAETSVAFWGTN